MSLNKFIADTTKTCIENNIDLRFYSKSSHMGSSGCFGSNKLWVCCDKGEGDWIPLLLHESCHMDQFLEKSEIWNDPIFDKVYIFDKADRKKHPILYKRAFRKAVELEIDCDLRALEKIKKYNLGGHINVREYCEESNIYHASYYYFYKYGCFYNPRKIPYGEKSLTNSFPDDRICSLDEAWRENKELGAFIKKYNKPS